MASILPTGRLAGVEALVLHGDVGQPQLAGDGAAGVRHGAGDVHQHLQ